MLLNPLTSVPLGSTTIWLPIVCVREALGAKIGCAVSQLSPASVERANHVGPCQASEFSYDGGGSRGLSAGDVMRSQTAYTCSLSGSAVIDSLSLNRFASAPELEVSNLSVMGSLHESP